MSLEETRRLLSPCSIDSEDASHYAVDDLKFALEQGNSRNIAVTGHYGSGKSSVVNTSIEELGIDSKVLRISMSTFCLQEEKVPNDNSYAGDIEYKIVQHLLYKCDKSRIPDSGFKRIHQPEVIDYRRHIVMALCALACYIIAFEPTELRIDSFYDAYYKLLGEKAGWWINLIADAGSIVYLIFFLFKACSFLASKLQEFKNIKVEAKGVTLEASKNAEVSVFNKYLDEILYIIQENDYDYILFEDLDRLANSAQLFLKIRELNMLINESEAFKSKNRVVKFIYAIKDDVFTRELRTKCFDYIVAVVPVVDHYNVADYVINDYQKKGLFNTIDNATLKQLTSRISGLRELKNIVNEYTLFEKSLRKHSDDEKEINEQELLAMIVYKNLYPQDFAKIYLKKGLLYTVFKNKELFTVGLTADFKELAKVAETSMAEARKKIVEIRKQYVDKLNHEFTVDKLIKDGYDYTLNEVATKDNLFEMFTNDDYDRYAFHDDNLESSGTRQYDFKFKDLEDMVTEDGDYFEAVSEEQGRYNTCNEELIRLEKEIKMIENNSLQEIMRKLGGLKTKELINRLYVKEYPADEKDKQTVDVNMVETLQTFIYRGYISDDYYLYISKFYAGSLSENDYQFVKAILQGIEKPYSQKLDNVKEVVDKLSVKDFEDKSVLNYDILNYLLDQKLEHYLVGFVETARKNPAFIVSYYQMAEKVNDQFFTRIYDEWDGCIRIIKMQEKQETGDALLKLFLREAPVNIRITDEEKKWLNSQYPFVNTNIKDFKTTKLKKFTTTYSLQFENLVKSNEDSKDFYDYCVTYRRFAINQKNLQVILGEDYNHKPMTAILEMENDKLRNYLLQDANLLVELFLETCDEEERSGLVYLIEESGVNIDWLKTYIERQKFVFDELDGIKENGAELLLGINKITPTWENVFTAFKLFKDNLNDTLKEFVIRHVDELSAQKCELPDDKPVELQEALLVTGKLPFDVFKKLVQSFDLLFVYDDILQIDDENRIREILAQDYIEYDKDILSHMSKTYSKALTSDYFIRYYDEILADEEIDVKQYVNNQLCIKILDSDFPIVKKGQFLLEYADIEVADEDSSYLAGKILQFYLTHGFSMGVNKKLLVLALQTYHDEHEWFLKIKLINKFNAIIPYQRNYEKELISSLRGEYTKLNTTYGRAKFEINEDNGTLLEYLKLKGHYVNNYEEKDGQYVVSFKSFMPD